MKGKKWLYVGVAAVLLSGLVLGSCVKPVPTEVIKLTLSHLNPHDPGDICTDYPMKFAELCDKYTDGRALIEVYGVGEIYEKYRDMGAACQAGELDFYVGNLASTFSYTGIPEVDICWRFPYYGVDFATKFEHVMAFLNDPVAGTKIKKLMRDGGVIWLDSLPTSPTCMALNTKAEAESDWKGLKIRATGGVSMLTVESTGATAVPLAFSEVAMALKTGVVDGIFTDSYAFNRVKFWEVGANYFCRSIVPYGAYYGLTVSTKTWEERLPADIKEIILEKVMPEMDTWGDDQSEKLFADVFDNIGRHCVVYDLSPARLKEVQDKLAELAWGDYEEMDPELFAQAKRIFGLD